MIFEISCVIFVKLFEYILVGIKNKLSVSVFNNVFIKMIIVFFVLSYIFKWLIFVFLKFFIFLYLFIKWIKLVFLK